MGASSQIIRSDLDIRSASIVPGLISHTVSSLRFNGSLNLEWAVLPPGRRSAAMPDDATGITIFFSDRNLDIRVLYKYVFPVPPGSGAQSAPPLSCKSSPLLAHCWRYHQGLFYLAEAFPCSLRRMPSAKCFHT